MREEPLLKKCCRCVPLRICLQTWAWFKVVADLTAALYITVGLLMFYFTHQYDTVSQFAHEHLFIMILVALIVDFLFVIILITGIFKKNYTYLRVFFYYATFMVFAEATILAVCLFLGLFKGSLQRWDGLALFCVIFLVMGLFWILIDISIILTLKSEMIKIRNKEQYDFDRIPPNTKSWNKTEKNTFREEHTENRDNKEEKYIKLLD